MPAPIEKKQDLEPNYCPSNYVPNYKEDAPALTKDLVSEPTAREEEDSITDKETNTNVDKSEGDNPADRQNKEDSGEDASADTEEDEYSELDYFY